jgi:glucose-6-phosphate 1-dehydrogenase
VLESASHNPLTAGLADTLHPAPCTLVILGGAGDLAKRKLLPAVYNLALDGVLPTNFAVIGIGHRELNDDEYRAFSREGIENYSRQPLEPNCWADHQRSIYFLHGEFESAATFTSLKKRLDEIAPRHGIPGNVIFYL